MRLDTGNIVKDLTRWRAVYLEEKTSGGCSSNTIAVYNHILETFVEYSRQYQDESGIEDINRMYLNAFLADRAKTAKSFNSSSRKLTVSVLKTFFSFITENNDNNVDLEKMFKKITIQRESKVKPSISDDEVVKLLRFLEKTKGAAKNNVINLRNSLLIKTMLYGGLRESELVPLRLKDYVVSASKEGSRYYSLLIVGKGGKERWVYIPADSVDDELDSLIAVCGSDWPICSTRNKTIINRTNLYQIVTGIYKRAGIDKAGLHILRHTFARRLVAKDVNLVTIKELLGHANIATTAGFYAKTDEKNKLNAVIRD